ncbi:MAG: ABC transporter ATP-binding protein [Rhizobacter sp.]|nr:ABC transporter ATP-binding protein [Burkholderiales bacterium]
MSLVAEFPPSALSPNACENLVELKDVSFGYTRARKILSGVTLAVPKGKLVAVMGGSGCGKTTILRLLCGQHRASSGEVLVGGQSVATMDREQMFAHRRKLGMLFQFGALFTDLSVFDNVAFPMREHTQLPQDIIHDLVLMKLNAVGLRGAARLKPSELSGGMARRVALARTIALDPQLALYDEPFAGLDPISLSVVGQLIRKLNDALNMTSILVTHDVVESMKIVDYIYFISEGRVVAHGDVPSIKASTDPFVRQFVDGQSDGPVRFHYPAKTLAEDFA